MTHQTAILLLVIALGAVGSPALSRRLGVPAAVVEILYGVGVTALGLAGTETVPFVRFLADLGFALFLFLAGLEVDARGLGGRGLAGFLGPTAAALGAFFLAYIACLTFGWSPWMALAMAATSVPLLLVIVRDAGLLATPVGRAMVTMAVIGEIVTIALVAGAEVFASAHSVAAAFTGLVRLARFWPSWWAE